MRYSCDVIKDLLPLYCDKVCTKDSAKIIEEHFAECPSCKALYQKMAESTKIEETVAEEEYEKQQVESIKKVKKKWKKGKAKFLAIGIPVGIAIAVILTRLSAFGAMGMLLVLNSVTSRIETYTDVAEYETYIGPKAISPYYHAGTDIFPEHIPADATVVDYQYTYYNPWDPQYVAYLTLTYEDEEFAKEMDRLAECGIEDYTGRYTVTGPPKGYRIAAMDSDEYMGFVYAMTSEKENTVTYVMIHFCNYFLDLDIHEYVPDEYLLEGFDATQDNPYREQIHAEKQK